MIAVIRFALFIALGIFVWGCAQPPGPPPKAGMRAFATAFIEEIGKQAPELTVRRVSENDPLALVLEDPNGKPSQVFLDNAYKRFQASPGDLAAIVEDHAAGILASRDTVSRPINRSKIVPVIRHTDYLDGAAARAFEADGRPLASETFGGDLVVLYVEDSERNVRYLSENNLAENGFPPATRRAQALENLKAFLPPVEIQGGGGTYLIYAGGFFESSLLLFNKIWESGALEVKGDIVAAVPARNVLVVTGSQDFEGLAAMDRIIAEATAKEPYTISRQRFLYRDGQFRPFNG